MNRSVKTIVISLSIFILTSGVFGAGVIVGSSPTVVNAQSRAGLFASNQVDVPVNFDLFWQALTVVQHNFVDKEVLTDENLTYGAIEGMIDSLGDQGHTAFLTPEEVEAQRSGMSGSFSGIGATVGEQNGQPVIIAPIDGSPAESAGVLAGDIIIKVDNQEISTLDLSEIIQQIRGKEGTDVVLTVLRVNSDGPETVDITITRGNIVVPAATWGFVSETDVALLRLSRFSANAAESVTTALNEAQDQGASALILDLRNNPGGLLQQAVQVTSQFIDEGNALLEEDGNGNRRAIKVTGDGVATNIPLIVLINAGSASSSEILAGAIQDHERGTLVGTTTFGTGTVLQPFALDDGSAIILGTRQWLTANGRLIRKHGIEPDIEIEQNIGAELVLPRNLKEMTLAEILTGEDLQLQKALELAGIELSHVEAAPLLY